MIEPVGRIQEVVVTRVVAGVDLPFISTGDRQGKINNSREGNNRVGECLSGINLRFKKP